MIAGIETSVGLDVVIWIFLISPAALAIVSSFLVFLRKSFVAGFIVAVIGFISALPLHVLLYGIGAYGDDGGGLKFADVSFRSLFMVVSPIACVLMIVIAAAQVDKTVKKRRDRAAARGSLSE